MKEFLRKNPRFLFYWFWLGLNLVQAAGTELQDDEAYYWVYSRYLDWGYFDHPPLTALLIKMGYAIFPNELGVRLFPLLINVLLLLVLEKLIEKKNTPLFYAMALSMGALQLMGFLAIPDIPLLFFTVLFFYCYKKFLEENSMFRTVMLGFTASLMLYSKYHAILIFFFVALSNPRLFKNYRLYLAGGIALLLFMPHIWWQYQHGWVSFRYHLFESNINDYKVSYTAEYLGGLILLAGPLLGLLLLPAAILYNPKTVFERSLRFTLIGIYVFFLLMSFRGKIELNWTSPALVPLILLSIRYLEEKKSWKIIIFRLLPVSLLLIVFARIVMLTDILPIKTIQSKFHSWDQWPDSMKQVTQGHNIVFSNSFQRASKYWFYTGVPTYSLNLYKGRRNNFNFWPIEDSLLGKPVYFLDTYDMFKYPDSVKTELGWVGFRYDTLFASFAKVRIQIPGKEYRIKEGKEIYLDCKFKLPAHYEKFIHNHPELNDTTVIGLFDNNGWIKDLPTDLKLANMNRDRTVIVNPGLPRGVYYFIFAIHQGKYFGTHNSEKIKLIIQ